MPSDNVLLRVFSHGVPNMLMKLPNVLFVKLLLPMIDPLLLLIHVVVSLKNSEDLVHVHDSKNLIVKEERKKKKKKDFGLFFFGGMVLLMWLDRKSVV